MSDSRPRRLSIEEATLAAIWDRPQDLDRIELLAQVARSRQTSATRLLDTLDQHQRMYRQQWTRDILCDIRDGTNSVLEHGYLHHVERPHQLPASVRQLREHLAGTLVIRDVAYVEFGLVVELDGRLDHSSVAARDKDIDRDLALALDGRASVRLGWGQVYDRPCHTAVRVARLLATRGWTGNPRPCGPTCHLRTD